MYGSVKRPWAHDLSDILVEIRLLVAQPFTNPFDYPSHLIECSSNVHCVEFTPRCLILDGQSLIRFNDMRRG